MADLLYKLVFRVGGEGIKNADKGENPARDSIRPCRMAFEECALFREVQPQLFDRRTVLQLYQIHIFADPFHVSPLGKLPQMMPRTE